MEKGNKLQITWLWCLPRQTLSTPGGIAHTNNVTNVKHTEINQQIQTPLHPNWFFLFWKVSKGYKWKTHSSSAETQNVKNTPFLLSKLFWNIKIQPCHHTDCPGLLTAGWALGAGRLSRGSGWCGFGSISGPGGLSLDGPVHQAATHWSYCCSGT